MSSFKNSHRTPHRSCHRGWCVWDYYFLHNDMRPESMWAGSQAQERVGELPALRGAQKWSKMQKYSEIRYLGDSIAVLYPLSNTGWGARWHRQHPAWRKSWRRRTPKAWEVVALAYEAKTLNPSGQHQIWKLSVFFILSIVLMRIHQVFLASSLNNQHFHDAISFLLKNYIWWLFYRTEIVTVPFWDFSVFCFMEETSILEKSRNLFHNFKSQR